MSSEDLNYNLAVDPETGQISEDLAACFEQTAAKLSELRLLLMIEKTPEYKVWKAQHGE